MGRSGERERSTLSTVLITAAALVAAWASIELAFKPFLAAGRASINRDLDPDYDPDDDLDESRPKSPNQEAEDAFESLKNQSTTPKDLWRWFSTSIARCLDNKLLMLYPSFGKSTSVETA